MTFIEYNEEDRVVVNDCDAEVSSCESIPEEFHHSPTIPNSPTESKAATESLVEGFIHGSWSRASQSKRSSKKYLRSSVESDKDVHQTVRTSKEEQYRIDSIKSLLKSWASNKHLRPNKDLQKFGTQKNNAEYNWSTLKNRKSTNKIDYKTLKSRVSPFKFYKRTKSRSPIGNRKSRKVFSPESSKNHNGSLIWTSNSNMSVKKNNQYYAKSLEEFAESNIMCINDLVEFKWVLNSKILKINTKNKSERINIDYQKKRQTQLKSDINNTLSANKSLINQNDDMLSKISMLRDKLKSKGSEYDTILHETEKALLGKKDQVNNMFTEVTMLNEHIYAFSRDSKQDIKHLELTILEAEKMLWHLNENLTLNRQSEVHRLQILRDKQKMLGSAIWKDSYQYF